MTPMPGFYGIGGETPIGRGGDTPASVISTGSSTNSGVAEPAVDTSMNLGAFQAKYTSEDNESFYHLMDRQNKKKNEKYAWLWDGNKILAARQIAHRQREQRLLMERNAAEAEDGGKQIRRIEDEDKRKAMPDSWTSRPDNTLMFAPSSVEDDLQTSQQRADEESRAPPKAVVYDNTRLPPALPPEQPVPPSPSLSAIKDAIFGRPRLSASELGSSVMASETPRVNGYTFVDSEEPEPEPSYTSPISFGPVDATPNPFVIKERSSREALHHRMVDKVARGKRQDKKLADLRTPVPKFTSSPRVFKDGLTPAAQKLLGKVGTATPRITNVWDTTKTKVKSGLGRSWGSRVSTPVSRKQED